METKIIYFVHGTTFDNASDKCSGWKQVELNELGKEQAINLGNLTSQLKFDYIFTSDLIRAIDSANFAWPNAEKIQDSRIRECNYGDYDGESKELVVYENYIETNFPNGESLNDVEKRMREFVEYLKTNYKGKTIALMAHRAPQLALEVITKNISWEEAIANDWRKTKSWQPGWEYIIK
jgi:broad specificity phosphatase PhoE